MAVIYKQLGKQIQDWFSSQGLSPDWQMIRQALLQTGAQWLWNQKNQPTQALPDLLKHTFHPSDQNQLLTELAPILTSLFAGKPVWEQLQILAGLAEQAAPTEVRKVAGLYYTPPIVSDFVVDKALSYWQPAQPSPFLDPACGSGLFLWGVIARLCDQESEPEHVAAWIQMAHGSDIDALALKVTDFGFKLYWQRRFPEITPPQAKLTQLNALSFENGQLSLQTVFPELQHTLGLLISNPPYVGERSNKELFDPLKTGYWAEHYRGRGDLYYFFFHLALALAKPETFCALLTPNYFLTATAAQYLRSRLQDKTQLLELIDFGDLRLFPAAHGHHSQLSIFALKRSEKAQVKVLYSSDSGIVRPRDLQALQQTQAEMYDQTSLFQGPQLLLSRKSEASLEAQFAQMQASGQTIGDQFLVRQGLVSGADRLSPRLRERYQLKPAAGSGIFVVDETEYRHLFNPKTADWLKPWFKNSDIKAHQPNLNNRHWLIYTHRTAGEPPQALLQHLERFRPVLEARREVQLGRIPWYQLQWPREPEMFKGPKILLPQRARVGVAAYTDQPWYASADVYYILPKPGSTWTLQQLLPLLNSELYTQWWTHRGKRKGGLIELYYQPLMATPLLSV